MRTFKGYTIEVVNLPVSFLTSDDGDELVIVTQKTFATVAHLRISQNDELSLFDVYGDISITINAKKITLTYR